MGGEKPGTGWTAGTGEEAPKVTWHAEWRRVGGDGAEKFDLLELDGAPHWILQGSLDLPGGDGRALWVRYRIACDTEWRTMQVLLATAANPQELANFPNVAPLLTLSADGKGDWHVNEQERPNLHGALDVDLGCSPSTNTLPIRRLNLGVGERAQVTATWVRFPDLAVLPLRQRYTRLAFDSYRYESLESGFTADLTVDDQGLVVDYPGGWQRLAE